MQCDANDFFVCRQPPYYFNDLKIDFTHTSAEAGEV